MIINSQALPHPTSPPTQKSLSHTRVTKSAAGCHIVGVHFACCKHHGTIHAIDNVALVVAAVLVDDTGGAH